MPRARSTASRRSTAVAEAPGDAGGAGVEAGGAAAREGSALAREHLRHVTWEATMTGKLLCRGWVNGPHSTLLLSLAPPTAAILPAPPPPPPFLPLSLPTGPCYLCRYAEDEEVPHGVPVKQSQVGARVLSHLRPLRSRSRHSTLAIVPCPDKARLWVRISAVHRENYLHCMGPRH